jgi:hypothetical protein
MNACGACGLNFGSVAAFDAHRFGRHGYTYSEGLRMDPPRKDGRRCVTPEEIAESSLFVQNAHGRWSLRAGLDAARTLRLLSPQRVDRPSPHRRLTPTEGMRPPAGPLTKASTSMGGHRANGPAPAPGGKS